MVKIWVSNAVPQTYNFQQSLKCLFTMNMQVLMLLQTTKKKSLSQDMLLSPYPFSATKTTSSWVRWDPSVVPERSGSMWGTYEVPEQPELHSKIIPGQ